MHSPSEAVRNLSFCIDLQHSLRNHIVMVTKNSHLVLRNIWIVNVCKAYLVSGEKERNMCKLGSFINDF